MQGYIQCDLLGPGMFPAELLVQITASDNSLATMFIDKSLTKTVDSKCFIRATIIESKNNITTCLLPVEPSSGSRWIKVPSGHLLK
jgi:hypothetical protein